MLLEGIGESIQQLIAMRGVMRALDRELGHPFPAAQVIEPVAAPGTVVQQAVEIASGDDASIDSSLPPTQVGLLHQRHQIGFCGGAAVVQFKSAHFC